MCLERSFFLVSHDMFVLNLSFDGYFHVSKWHIRCMKYDERAPQVCIPYPYSFSQRTGLGRRNSTLTQYFPVSTEANRGVECEL